MTWGATESKTGGMRKMVHETNHALHLLLHFSLGLAVACFLSVITNHERVDTLLPSISSSVETHLFSLPYLRLCLLSFSSSLVLFFQCPLAYTPFPSRLALIHLAVCSCLVHLVVARPCSPKQWPTTPQPRLFGKDVIQEKKKKTQCLYAVYNAHDTQRQWHGT